MTKYRRIAVASAFSPTFASVLAEADRLATQQGASLEILHVAPYDAEKEARFHETMGRSVRIHWLSGENPAEALAEAAREMSFDLLVAGALQRETTDKPYANAVARALLRSVTCDLLLLAAPVQDDSTFAHIVFACDPEEEYERFVRETSAIFPVERVTVAVTETPFAAALAISRGEQPCDIRAWSAELEKTLQESGLSADTWVVASNTGYAFCEAVQGLEADLLVVKAEKDNHKNPLPVHLDWLYQIIPLRLLVVRDC